MKTTDIPRAVAERMILTGGSEEARMELNDLGIDGSRLDDITGYMHFKFRGEHRVDAMKRSPRWHGRGGQHPHRRLHLEPE